MRMRMRIQHGNCTVAVVEWPDGTVESVPVNLIQFINQE